MTELKKPEKKRNKGLSGKQQIALNTLLSGGSCQDAASAAGVSKQTISEYRANPHFISQFNQEINKLRRAAIATYRDRIRGLVDSSLSTLEKSIQDGDTVSCRWLLDKTVGLSEVVTEKYYEINKQPDPLLTEDIDEIITGIADRILRELAEEQGVTELQFAEKDHELRGVRQKLIMALEDEYHGKE